MAQGSTTWLDKVSRMDIFLSALTLLGMFRVFTLFVLGSHWFFFYWMPAKLPEYWVVYVYSLIIHVVFRVFLSMLKQKSNGGVLSVQFFTVITYAPWVFLIMTMLFMHPNPGVFIN